MSRLGRARSCHSKLDILDPHLSCRRRVCNRCGVRSWDSTGATVQVKSVQQGRGQALEAAAELLCRHGLCSQDCSHGNQPMSGETLNVHLRQAFEVAGEPVH